MEKWEVYVEELRTQVRFAVITYRLFTEARDLGCAETIFMHLHHFMVHIASIDRLLSCKPESARAKALEKRIDLKGIQFKQAKRMRNHLEHYDDRLDKWIEDHWGSAFFDMNIITGASGFPHEIALRALDGDTLYFAGEAYCIPELLYSVSQLDQRLAVCAKFCV